jgi:hypothetical protein
MLRLSVALSGITLEAAPGEGPAPVLLARESISVPGTHESVSAFTTDRVLVTRCAPDFTACRILEAVMAGGSWRVLGPADFAPATPAAGAVPFGDSRVLFHSTPATPGEGTGADWKIAEAVRVSGGWERRPLPAPVASKGRECCVATAGARAFYFSSDREGSWEIYRAESAGAGAWTVKKLPPEINASRAGQWPSQAGPGESHLLFSSIRKTGSGGDDIYVAFRDGSGWTPARLLPAPVNTAAYEDGARLSSDGRRLFFSSTRPLPGDESANVYSIDIGDLLDPPRPAR